jgi:hypothetical protein
MTDPRQSWEPWYRDNRRRLANDGLYLDGGEPGRQDPAEFHRASTKILICRLSTYDDVVSSISHRMLYWAARQIPGVYVDLAFFPPARDAVFLKNNGVPLWLASGCKMPPTAFDIVAVSISVPQEAFNLPTALRDSGLLPGRDDGIADPSQPLVILGGQAAGSVPFVHGMVDAVCLGDGIGWLQECLKRFSESRQDFLRTLAMNVEGSYVPSLYRHEYQDGSLKEIVPLEPDIPFPVPHRADHQDSWISGYDGAYIPFSEEDTEETLPLAFGCAYRCRFCQTGWLRKHLDASDREKLRGAALRLKSAMAACDLNLLASDACSVPALASIVGDLRQIFPRVSVKSLAVSSLAHDRGALDLIEKREFTFGIEGVSERLRAYLGKPIAAGSLVQIVRDLGSARFRQMKLFFIATGLETDEDIGELDELLQEIHSAAPGCRLITSFMPLFNAPFTPLQFDELRVLSPDLCRRLERVVKGAGAEFRWSASPDEIRLMNLLSRAGRAAASIVSKLSLEDGVRYYDSLPGSALKEAERILNPELAKARRESDVLPWDDLEAGARRSVLWKSFKKAKSDSSTPSDETAEAIAPRRPMPSAQSPTQAVSFWIQIAEANAHHPGLTVARGFLRELFASNPGAAKAYGGNPQVQHPPGTSGLALLTAQFRGTVSLPGAVESRPAFDELVFLAELETASVRKVLEELKAGHIPFQTERHGNDRWSVIKKGYRNKVGLWALCERDTAPGLVLCSPQSKHLAGFNARVTGVFEKSGAVLQLLKFTTAIQIPESVIRAAH